MAEHTERGAATVEFEILADVRTLDAKGSHAVKPRT